MKYSAIKFLTLAIFSSLTLNAKAASADSSENQRSTLENMGFARIYEAKFVIPSFQLCKYDGTAYHGGPGAYGIQFLSEKVAVDDATQAKLPIKNFAIEARYYWQPVDSCETMNPVGDGIPLKHFLFANEVQVVDSQSAQIEIRFSSTAAQDYYSKDPKGYVKVWMLQVSKDKKFSEPKFDFSEKGIDFQIYERWNGETNPSMHKYERADGTLLPEWEEAKGALENYLPVSQLSQWAKDHHDSLTTCDKLKLDADKTRAEAQAVYEKLFSYALEGGSKLKGPDGHGLRNIAEPFRLRSHEHVRLMRAEPTCREKDDINPFQNAMDSLVEEIRKLEIMSQSLWG